jgi:peptidoglycan hydrolase CwlO-like protein
MSDITKTQLLMEMIKDLSKSIGDINDKLMELPVIQNDIKTIKTDIGEIKGCQKELGKRIDDVEIKQSSNSWLDNLGSEIIKVIVVAIIMGLIYFLGFKNV